MTQEKIDSLTIEYPSFFQDTPDRGWGIIECGDGWLDILRELCYSIDNSFEGKKDFRFLQIKDKFGRLRIYTNSHCETVERLISIAEKKSESTCEHCGDIRIRTGSMSVFCSLCERCWKNGLHAQ